MRTILAAAFVLVASVASAQTAPIIIAADGTYLGQLSANPYAADSTSNPYGKYGSPYAKDSITNPYGTYGSPYSPLSPTNPYASTPPRIISVPPTVPVYIAPQRTYVPFVPVVIAPIQPMYPVRCTSMVISGLIQTNCR